MPVALQVGGAVDRATGLYIERAEDEDLLALLTQSRYANVLTSRQMGKSSLVLSTARKLIDRGIDCVIVDAGELGVNESQLDAYAGLLESIRDQLMIDMDVDDWLTRSPRGTPNQHFLRFFREIGEQVSRPVVIFLDEIDSTLEIPYADELFTAIRTIHNERSLYPGYRRFTFCLVGVASPNDLIKNQRITAYNIGVTLELHDFDRDRDDLSPLLPLLHSDRTIAAAMLDAIFYWTDGHPYLTMKLAQDLAEQGETDVDAYVHRTYLTLRNLRTDAHFEQIIRWMSLRLSEALKTFALYERILTGVRVPDLQAVPQRQLKLSGLVKRNADGNLIVRNRIYAALFNREWVTTSRPDRTVRRLRLIVAVLAASVLVFVAGTWWRARETAHRHLDVIERSSDFPEATRSFETLTGKREAPVPAMFFLPYRGDAQRAYQRFKTRHANELRVLAATARQREAVDEALLYGARAADVGGTELDRETSALFRSAGFDRLMRTLRGPPVLSGGISVSADGRLVAIASSVWSSADGRLLYELPDKFINAVAVDDSDRLYSGDDNGDVKRWVRTVPELVAAGNSTRRRPIRVIAVSPDGQLIGTVSTGASVALLRKAGGPTVATLAHAEGSRVATIRFSSASTAVTAADDRTARLWTWEGRLIATLRHREPVTAAAISRDGSIVATAAGTLLTIWNGQGAKIGEIRETSEIANVAVSNDGSEVAVVTTRAFQRYRVTGFDQVGSIPHEGFVAVTYGPDAKWAVTRSATLARIWNLSPDARATFGGIADLQQRLGLKLTEDGHNVIEPQ